MKSAFCPNEEILNKVRELKPSDNKLYNVADDVSNGRIFADVFRDVARYNATSKCWYIYDGRVWKEDKENLVCEGLAKKLYLALIIYAIESETDSNYQKSVRKLGRRNARETMLKDARSYYKITNEDLDKDIDLFNCPNGTLNLRTGEFRDHNPDDLLSRIANVEYNPTAICPTWEKFISEIMQDDEDKMSVLQDGLGYSIGGRTDFECFFITYGKTSRNGKGTLNSTIQYMLGEYSGTASPDTFTSKRFKNSSDAPNDTVASLVGTHYVSVSEPEEQMVLDSALIKALTGNDRIRVRKLYEGGFEFVATYKIWINTNHLPQIPDESVFDSDRVVMISFDRHFEPEERDTTLKDKLKQKDELSGIFNWCYEGYKRSMGRGRLVIPDSVREGIKAYAKSQDRIQEFLNEATERVENSKLKLSDLYKAYKSYCYDSGYKSLGRNKFENKLNEKGFDIREYGHQKNVFSIGFTEDYRNPFDNVS